MAPPFHFDQHQYFDVGDDEKVALWHRRFRKCLQAMNRAQQDKLWNKFKEDNPATITSTTSLSVETKFGKTFIGNFDTKLCVKYGILHEIGNGMSQ